MSKKGIFRFIIITGIVLFFTSCIQEKVPGIKFDTRIYKFGEVDEGEKVSYTFTYLNSGTDTLEIYEVRPTCGCTVPGDYTREVPRGKTGKIPVVFNTKGFEGNVVKTIKVKTNIPDLEQVNLTLEGTIKVKVRVTPHNLWFGQTRKDGPPLTGILTLKNFVDTPLEILDIHLSGEGCTAELRTITRGDEYEIVLTVNPPFKLEQVREILTVETNIKGKEKLEIPYNYYGVSDIEIYPDEIILYNEYLQPDISRIITIKNHLDESVEIINPRIHGDNMEFRIEEIEKGRQIQVFIVFKDGFTFPENDTIAFSFMVQLTSGSRSFTIPIKNGGSM